MTRTPLEGDALTAWRNAAIVDKHLSNTEAALLDVLCDLPIDYGDRRYVTPDSHTTAILQHLEQLGLLVPFYLVGRRLIGAVRLHAYDPPYDPYDP